MQCDMFRFQGPVQYCGKFRYQGLSNVRSLGLADLSNVVSSGLRDLSNVAMSSGRMDQSNVICLVLRIYLTL